MMPDTNTKRVIGAGLTIWPPHTIRALALDCSVPMVREHRLDGDATLYHILRINTVACLYSDAQVAREDYHAIIAGEHEVHLRNIL